MSDVTNLLNDLFAFPCDDYEAHKQGSTDPAGACDVCGPKIITAFVDEARKTGRREAWEWARQVCEMTANVSAVFDRMTGPKTPLEGYIACAMSLSKLFASEEAVVARENPVPAHLVGPGVHKDPSDPEERPLPPMPIRCGHQEYGICITCGNAAIKARRLALLPASEGEKI